MKRFFTLLLIMVAGAYPALANTYYSDHDSVQSLRIDEKIVVDGLLSELSWQRTKGVSNFTQKNPVENAAPSQKTVVYVLYDDEALYIGARMFDSAPDSIIARLGRRDSEDDSDIFGVFIDPYLDRRSGFYFGITAAGAYLDGVMMNDEWTDDSWDGVWEGEVRINEQGWSSEFRIPYSQLRFQKKDIYSWGINFIRLIQRYNEEDYLVFTPKNSSGFVSRFPTLVGLHDIHPAGTLEVLPYVRTKAEYLNVENGDPFNDGSRYLQAVGGDIKIGLSSNLTLDGTVNPDFGQVEVDPAVVNLSDVETFYDEKRPFFLEGANIFRFGQGGSRSNWGFNWGSPDFFYTRRIGRPTQGGLPDYEYADIPEGSRIAGAAKLTGRIGKGWNLGMVHAVTNREFAEISLNGNRSRWEVEPLTYYGVLRSQKEINDGFRGLGFISTYTHRIFDHDHLRNELNRSAFGFGTDGWTFLDADRVWVISGWTGMSRVMGSQQRMLNLQESSAHYFQRPDAKTVSVDSSATSLTGFAGRLTLNKQKGNVIFNSALGVIDPGFDVNDLGFMWRTDLINAHVGGGYKFTKPTRIYREASFIGALFGNLNFDKDVVWSGLFFTSEIEFTNFYEMELQYAYNPQTISNRSTRGGPLMLTPSGWEVDFSIRSDERKPLVLMLESMNYFRPYYSKSQEIQIELQWKPASNISLNFGPRMMWDNNFAQWVDVFTDASSSTYGKRYVFAEMDQVEFAASIRLNWTFSPKLSFQMYLQPLISAGNYHHFKELARTKSYDFNVYGRGASTIDLEDNVYTVDPDGSGAVPIFEFSNPDFNYSSLRANAVLRWEYLPGSTLYLVWTQSRTQESENGRFRFEQSMHDLRQIDPDNIFMIKMNYWMNF